MKKSVPTLGIFYKVFQLKKYLVAVQTMASKGQKGIRDGLFKILQKLLPIPRQIRQIKIKILVDLQLVY